MRHALPVTGAVWALAASVAFAGDEAAISTAPPVVPAGSATKMPDTTGAQISAWMRENDNGALEQGSGIEPAQQPRQVHGQVSVGFGSGGYSGVSGIADIPVGQSSDLVVAASRNSFNGHGFHGTQQSLSVGLFLDGAKPQASSCGHGAGPLGYGAARPSLTGLATLDGDGRPGDCGMAPDASVAHVY